MKKFIFIFSLSLLQLLYFKIAYCQEAIDYKIIKINFYYIPWNCKPPKSLSEIEVRDYFNKTSVFEITDSLTINEFWKATSIFNLQLFKKKDFIDVRMVIDFYTNSGNVHTFLVDDDFCIEYQNSYYFPNLVLKRAINSFVPPASSIFE